MWRIEIKSAEGKMKMSNEKIKKQIFLPLGACLVVLVLISALGICIFEHHYMNEHQLCGCMVDVERIFALVQRERAELMSSQIDMLKSDRKLQEAWLSEDRKALLDYTSPLLEEMRLKYGVTHFYFHTPKRICFLRVHNPDFYGDYTERATLAQTVKDQKDSFGVEIGTFGTLAVRAAQPWYIDGKPAGYIELGIDNNRFASELKKVFKGEILFVVDKAYLSRSRWEKGLKAMDYKGQWERFGDFVVVGNTMEHVPEKFDESLAQLSEHIEREYVLGPGGQHPESMFRISPGGRSYSAKFVPIIDAEGLNIGDIIVLRDIPGAKANIKILTVGFAGSVFVVLVMLFFVFNKLVNKIKRRFGCVNEELKEKLEERRQAEETLRQSDKSLHQEIYQREQTEAKLEKQIAELEKARVAALNVMEDAERSDKLLYEKKEELASNNEFLHKALESLTHPFYVIDANDCTIKMANKALYSGELPAGATCYGLTHNVDKPCDGDEHPCPLKMVKKTRGPVVIEQIHCDESGRPRNIEIHAYPLFDDKGNVTEIIQYCFDVTERKEAEAALAMRYDFERLITAISTEFINLKPNEIDSGIDRALAKIGEFVGIDRSYIFQYSSDGTTQSNTHEWCKEGIPAQIDRLQNMPVDSLQWFTNKMRKHEVVYVNGLDELPEQAKAFRKELEIESTQSLICVPVIRDNKLIGFAGFDTVRDERKWTDDIVDLLHIVGTVFANALSRKQNDNELRLASSAAKTEAET